MTETAEAVAFWAVLLVLMVLERKARERWPKRTAGVALIALAAVMIWCRPISPVLIWWHGFAVAFNGSIIAKKES